MRKWLKKTMAVIMLMATFLNVIPVNAFALSVTSMMDSVSTVTEDGWKQRNDNWYYYQNNKAVTGWNRIDGYWCYFDSMGVLQTGWQKINGTWYFLDERYGCMHTGWVQDDDFWFHLDRTGALQYDWQKVDSSWYYFDEDYGYMHTGWVSDGGSWYYLKSSGAMAANETLTISGKTYQFGSTGAMKENTASSSSGTSSGYSYTVYVSRYGKIHTRSNCSGMKYYTTMTYSAAKAAGYVECKKCF